jgi:hypothetical protein
MAAAREAKSADPFIVLSRWCGQTSSWRDLPARHDSVGAAESAATDRGIYRVVFVSGGRRLPMEPFGVIGSHPADELQECAEPIDYTRSRTGDAARPLSDTAGAG